MSLDTEFLMSCLERVEEEVHLTSDTLEKTLALLKELSKQVGVNRERIILLEDKDKSLFDRVAERYGVVVDKDREIL